MLPTAAVATTAAESATQTETTVSDTELVDSRLSYVETVETIANPGAGYTTTDWYTCAPGNTPIHDKNGNVVLMFIDIGKFSSGANGTTNEDGTYVEGTDYDLDEQFFQNVRASFENCRKMVQRLQFDSGMMQTEKTIQNQQLSTKFCGIFSKSKKMDCLRIIRTF